MTKGVTVTTTENDTLPRFHSASISKLFTAVVIMQLRDEGKLALTDRVGQYVPAFDGHEIRLEHLLTHTSGLRDRKRANGRTRHEEVDVYVEALAAQRLSGAPGATWRYSDAGFNLLGRVIENVTGKLFAEVMNDRLLQPLGMTSSSFDIASIPSDLRVPGFSARGRQLDHPSDLAFQPSSGLQTNARDLAKFAQTVLRANSSSEGANLLRSEALREMTVVHTATEWDGITQGFGWQIVESESGPVWRHAGGEAGLEGLLAIYPTNGFAVIALGNQEDWPRFQLVAGIRDAAANASPALCTL